MVVIQDFYFLFLLKVGVLKPLAAQQIEPRFCCLLFLLAIFSKVVGEEEEEEEEKGGGKQTSHFPATPISSDISSPTVTGREEV